MNNEEFYNKCADLLDTSYDCIPFPWYKRTRWNNRAPGSGRFPGFGIIRVYGDNIQVSIRHPINHQKIYKSKDEVLQFLSNMLH